MNFTNPKLVEYCLRAHFGKRDQDTDEESNSSSEGNVSLDEEYFRLQPPPILSDKKRVGSPNIRKLIELTKEPNISTFQTFRKEDINREKGKSNQQFWDHFEKRDQDTGEEYNSSSEDNVSLDEEYFRLQPPPILSDKKRVASPKTKKLIEVTKEPNISTFQTSREENIHQEKKSNKEPSHYIKLKNPVNIATMATLFTKSQKLSNNLEDITYEKKSGKVQPPIRNSKLISPNNTANNSLDIPQKSAYSLKDIMNEEQRKVKLQSTHENELTSTLNDANKTNLFVKAQTPTEFWKVAINKKKRNKTQPLTHYCKLISTVDTANTSFDVSQKSSYTLNDIMNEETRNVKIQSTHKNELTNTLNAANKTDLFVKPQTPTDIWKVYINEEKRSKFQPSTQKNELISTINSANTSFDVPQKSSYTLNDIMNEGKRKVKLQSTNQNKLTSTLNAANKTKNANKKRAASTKTKKLIEVTKRPNISTFQTSREKKKHEKKRISNKQPSHCIKLSSPGYITNKRALNAANKTTFVKPQTRNIILQKYINKKKRNKFRSLTQKRKLTSAIYCTNMSISFALSQKRTYTLMDFINYDKMGRRIGKKGKYILADLLIIFFFILTVYFILTIFLIYFLF